MNLDCQTICIRVYNVSYVQTFTFLPVENNIISKWISKQSLKLLWSFYLHLRAGISKRNNNNTTWNLIMLVNLCLLPENTDLSRQGLEITVVFYWWHLMNQLFYWKTKVFPARQKQKINYWQANLNNVKFYFLKLTSIKVLNASKTSFATDRCSALQV